MSKVLFFSYSHDSIEHCAWVKFFAEDLASLGDFEILLDQNLPKGYSFTRFMEYGLSVADKVLVIGTPQYKEKSMKGKGVAFEEAIISADLMRNIDTTKYYPILRSGTFEDSFPPILQGRNGDDLSDDTKYDVTVKSIADLLMSEKSLPAALSRVHAKDLGKGKSVANVRFRVQHLFTEYLGNVKEEGFALCVTVTNTERETRYFDEPYFKLSTPFEGTADAFTLLRKIQRIDFPVKLEYGQQFFVSYRLVSANIEEFRVVSEKDPDATIKAVVVTTLDEISESEFCKMSEIVRNARFL